MASHESDYDSSIEEKSIDELANTLERCKGHYSFLIGAGTSKRAGIPTANELVERWKEQNYEQNHPDVTLDTVSNDEIEEWGQSIQSDEMVGQEQEYGFWFEKLYTTRGERRQVIRDLVNDAEPSFGHIVLASMMADGYAPITLTPNFDDLLYDAFYYFLEEKPLLINHDAIAPQFRLTQDRPAIIKLHGDYLYDNLKNTNSETLKLEKNTESAVSRCLDEYGMVVIGYGGNDESIMNVINSEDIPDFGLFWCGLSKDDVSDKAYELLQKPNTFFVEIDGFEELMSNLYSKLDDVSIPMPDEIIGRARDREEMLIEKVGEIENTGLLELFMLANRYTDDGDYDTAIDLYTRVIEGKRHDGTDEGKPALGNTYSQRGMTYLRNGNRGNALRDYEKVLDNNDSPGSYLELAEAHLINEDPDKVYTYINKAYESEEPVKEQVAIFLRTCAKILESKDYSEDKKSLKDALSRSGMVGWEFTTLKKGLEHMRIGDEKKDKIEALIELCEEHPAIAISPGQIDGPQITDLEDFV